MADVKQWDVFPTKIFESQFKTTEEIKKYILQQEDDMINHAPKTGGQLIIPDIDEEIKPISNRLVSFPIQYDHKIESYTGNRVSIGIIFWPEIPLIYKNADENNILTFNRLWEEEDKRNTI